ncbi:hypothetical protein PQO03_05895 [Lentisphaera profundi]|uniref:3-keto-disaccharide hydrolase domain-containing protein n=1 Tax=Lentisphaera profundi TaxID=1658616 RepID=A0ABY7VND5_9BACT|nr:hypothetical protein [Lentisphaera profundi]WDE95251.1 hypothetical protein PQO03_05895 [Lentisphaera profundi]
MNSKTLLDDDCKKDWQENWFLDSVDSTVKNTPKGMILTAGPDPDDNAQSMVLWTKQEFEGDIKIEYEFTRLDNLDRNVNILYFHARGIGIGPYKEDISKWNHLRTKPRMPLYFLNMKLYHISYAVNRYDLEGEYLRARRYPSISDEKFNKSTEIPGSYWNTGLFKPGVKYKLIFEKTGKNLSMKVRGPEINKEFSWKLNNFAELKQGRIGLRLMSGRSALISNFKVSKKI